MFDSSPLLITLAPSCSRMCGNHILQIGLVCGALAEIPMEQLPCLSPRSRQRHRCLHQHFFRCGPDCRNCPVLFRLRARPLASLIRSKFSRRGQYENNAILTSFLLGLAVGQQMNYQQWCSDLCLAFIKASSFKPLLYRRCCEAVLLGYLPFWFIYHFLVPKTASPITQLA